MALPSMSKGAKCQNRWATELSQRTLLRSWGPMACGSGSPLLAISDAVVSASLLRNVGEVYRKIRNTCRFLLQNMYIDFGERSIWLLLKAFVAGSMALGAACTTQ